MTFSTNRIVTKTIWTIASMCLAQMAGQAQAIWLPGSDPVNIARSGVGVAYGRSIEACSLNPALLVTLQGKGAVYLAGGMEMQSAQLTLPSNGRTLFTSDRNRFMPAFGAGWRVSSKLALGLKVDTPFMRHAELPKESSSRFFGQAIDINTLRTEFQVAYAASDAFSVGVSAGMTRLDYASAVALRLLVPDIGSLPAGSSNPVEALLESNVRQEGSVSALSFGVGFRYAINSRWTIGGSYQSGIKGRPDLSAYVPNQALDTYNTRGYADPPPPIGIEDRAQAVLNASTPYAGSGDLSLPYRIQLGVRNRLNQITTWEIDLRYVGGSGMEIPNHPWLTTPSGNVNTHVEQYDFKDGLAFSGMLELNLSKDWVARAGFSLEPALLNKEQVNALLGGTASAGFSIGFGYRILGGELSAGYQYRQSQDRDTNGLEGVWSVSGLNSAGTLTRVEGMGHLWSIGFRKSF